MKQSTTISLIGLGEIGSSIGAALRPAKDQFFRIGYDPDINLQRTAQHTGVIDKAFLNIHQAVQDAQIIALCVSWADLQSTLQTIAPSIKEGSVILEVSPMKRRVAEWIKAYFPASISYVGIFPVERILEDSAASDQDNSLLSHMPIYLAAPSGTSPHAMDLVTHLIQAMDAQPVYIDLLELDGLLAKSQLLPPLLAHALLLTCVNQGGWQETRKLASLPFAYASSAIHAQTPEELVVAWSANQDNTLCALDDLIASLTLLRQTIAVLSEESSSESQFLASACAQTQQALQTWWSERLKENWKEGVPLPKIEKRNFLSRFSLNDSLHKSKRKD